MTMGTVKVGHGLDGSGGVERGLTESGDAGTLDPVKVVAVRKPFASSRMIARSRAVSPW